MSVRSIFLRPLRHRLSQFLPFCFPTAILVFGATLLHAQIPQNGLVAHYAFEGDAQSSTGDFDGTLLGGAAISSTNGINGEFLLCDGDNDYVNISENVPILSDFDSNWSASAWFRADAVPGAAVGDNRFIVFETSGDFTISLGLRAGTTGKTNVQFFTNSSGGAPNLVHPLDDADVNGKWIHATLTFEKTGGTRTLRAYVNGALVVTRNVPGTVNNAGDGFHIGAYRDAGQAGADDRFFKGGIDDVAIWQRTLTAAEIEILAIPPIIVTTAADEGPGSLRQTIAESSEGGLIVFDPDLDGSTITLTGSQLTVPSTTDGFFIDASSLPSGLTIDAGQQSRVMLIEENATAALNGLTLTGGVTSGDGGGILADSNSDLSLTACTVSGNRTGDGADGVSGGIGRSGGDGGGISAQSNSTLSLTACTISGNQTGDGGQGRGSGGFGGGISAATDSILTLTACTLSGNQTGAGGQGSNSGGTGGAGGGIFARSSTLRLTACTISGNQAGQGGAATSAGGSNGSQGSAGGVFVFTSTDVTIGQSIIAGNTGGSGDFDPGNINNNLGGNLLTGDPRLAPLGFYGGPTRTMPPLTGSPAIDAAGSSNPGGTDQRGLPRFVGGMLDIGAVEFQGNETELDLAFFEDLDGDGTPVGVELAIGSDPRISDPSHPSKLRVAGFGAEGSDEGSAVLTFGYLDGTIPLRIARSTDLITFVEFTVIPGGAAQSGIFTTFDLNPPAGKAFYRLEVTRPE